jgi:hypothetical protein
MQPGKQCSRFVAAVLVLLESCEISLDDVKSRTELNSGKKA